MRVMVVDDEAAMREVLEARLTRWGYEVQTADCAKAAAEVVARFDPDVVVSDLILPDATGLDVLEAVRAVGRPRTVLLITAYGTIDTAVKAIKAGATDFLTKPLDYPALRAKLEAAEAALARTTTTTAAATAATATATAAMTTAATTATTTAATTTVAAGEHPSDGGDGEVDDDLVGEHPLMIRLRERIAAAAKSDAPVLIIGESGTGKEVVAARLVAGSTRADKPFVSINAAAIPGGLVESELFGHERGAFTGADTARPGLFEQADGGTLFLDEISEMPIALQAKLLRVLEVGVVRRLGGRKDIPCDVRVIAATNRNPSEAVERGLLRHDLVYRLDVLRLDLPPLRERGDDIALLSRHFIAQNARRYGVPAPQVDDDVFSALARWPFLGNVRELKNLIERAFVLSGGKVLRPEHLGIEALAASADHEPRLPPTTAHGIVIPSGVTLADAERILILETLKQTNNNKAEAARRLGLDVKTIRNKLKQFPEGAPGGKEPGHDGGP
jgi:DNA-binding NtrC family response regulator